MAIAYASEKLEDAVIFLACIDASLEERLNAAIREVTLLRAERDFPVELRQEFDNLIKQIIEYRVSGDNESMRSKLAEVVFYLLVKVERKYDFIIDKIQDYDQD